MTTFNNTFKVPTEEGPIVEVPCKLVTVDIPHWGEYIFAIHKSLDPDKPDLKLAHYASGRGVGRLTPIKREKHHRHIQITDERAAKKLIDRTIKAYGLGRVMNEITNATRIN